MPISATVPVFERSRRPGAGGLVVALLAVFVLLASGCVSQSRYKQSGTLDYDPSLLTGERMFGEPVPVDDLPRIPIAEPSEAMLDYVERTVRRDRLASQRFRDLFGGLNDDGYFQAVYSANRTLTAAETFDSQGGNCLSYTNMFIALARAAGLDAKYQIVEVPPSWDAGSGFLIRYTHINVLLKGLRLDHHEGQDVIVDFNIVHPDPDYPRRAVSDEYAESLFYANKSVRLLREGQPRESFRYLRRAIEIAPENVDLWINLGAFYATHGHFHESVEAYEVALQIDPRSRSAYSGLARSHANMGDHELAAEYEGKVRNYRERNPFYHYAMAQSAFEDADYRQSLDYINTAIALKRRNARFHLLKSLVEERLGDPGSARESLERAKHLGLERAAKLDLLRSLARVNAI